MTRHKLLGGRRHWLSSGYVSATPTIYVLVLSLTLSPCLQAKSTGDDEHIRQIVSTMLREKDRQIEQLEARIKQLEQQKAPVQQLVDNHKAQEGAISPAAAQSDKSMASTEAINAKSADPQVSSKLKELSKKVDELKSTAEANGLLMSGFFDINAKTSNSTDQTFSVGSVELDLDYVHDDHFGASTALVLCGNSANAENGAPAHIVCGNSGAGGLSGGNTMAGIAVAMVDYHLFNDRIPPRGRIFNNQGLHIQAGRFDLPFGTDYQFFANKDRVTVTAPLTTSRMQLGGFNSDGIRSYGSWGMLNYSAFWTDSVYGETGHAIGGRLGLLLGQNTYTIHYRNPEAIEIGVSHLSDLDGHNAIRNTVYGADLTFNYGMWHLQNELMLLQGHQDMVLEVAGTPGNFVGKGHQLGYHSTLSADLESFVNQPIRAFVRYSRWQPSQTLGLDFDGSGPIALNDISMLSLGFNYKFSDHLRLKLEYDDSLGTWIAERYFDKRLGIAQIVMSF